MPTLLCFDLDGTLIDSAPDYVHALNRTLAERGKGPLEHDFVVSHIGNGLRALVVDLFPELTDPTLLRGMVDRFLALYEEDMFSRTRLYPEIREILADATARGHQLGLITNKNERPARALLEHFGLSGLPWVGVFGADTLAERKPSPLPLHEMMRRAGRPPAETWMIGDGTPDVESAQAAGVAFVGLEYGYTDPKILRDYNPLYLMKDTRELAVFLASLP